MPFREKGSRWKPARRGRGAAPWTRVPELESGRYLDAVADKRCTPDEIRELALMVAEERGWHFE